eukprot:4287845-Ditylum_brightwellii.AAC.1
MTYTDGVNNNDNNACHNNDPLHGHPPAPIQQDYFIKRPQYVICSMEDSAMHKIQRIKNKRDRGFARHKTHLVKCSMPYCPIIAHTCAPTESQTTCFPEFLGMSYFEIAHSPLCQDLFCIIERGGILYRKAYPNHTVVNKLKSMYCEITLHISEQKNQSVPPPMLGDSSPSSEDDTPSPSDEVTPTEPS